MNSCSLAGASKPARHVLGCQARPAIGSRRRHFALPARDRFARLDGGRCRSDVRRSVERTFLTQDGNSRRSCCQNRSTVQPRAARSASTRRSRAELSRNLSAQKRAFVFGRVPCNGQLCQKHPSTKTATRRAPNTMSGEPGKRTLNRYLAPFRQSAWRSASSMSVPRCRTRPIKALRSILVRRSMRAAERESRPTYCWPTDESIEPVRLVQRAHARRAPSINWSSARWRPWITGRVASA